MQSRNNDSGKAKREESTTATVAKTLSPAAPQAVLTANTKPFYDNQPHRYMTPDSPNDLPPPAGYVRRQVGITGAYHFDQTEEEYYDHLLLNYS
jgi:hypothetical protein